MPLNPKQRIDDHIAFRVEQSMRDLQGQLGELGARLEAAGVTTSEVAKRVDSVETEVGAGVAAIRQLSVEVDVMQHRVARLVEDVTDRMLKLERAVTQLEREREEGGRDGGSPT